MDDLNQTFATLKPLLQHYQPPLAPKEEKPGYYDLWSFKPVEIEGRKRKEVYFAGLVLRKSYVGFYFMPVYAEPETRERIPPELLKLLKGKSCFHIKKLTPELVGQIERVLQAGFRRYQERGWV